MIISKEKAPEPQPEQEQKFQEKILKQARSGMCCATGFQRSTRE
jgi:hypothetical protein